MWAAPARPPDPQLPCSRRGTAPEAADLDSLRYTDGRCGRHFHPRASSRQPIQCRADSSASPAPRPIHLQPKPQQRQRRTAYKSGAPRPSGRVRRPGAPGALCMKKQAPGCAHVLPTAKINLKLKSTTKYCERREEIRREGEQLFFTAELQVHYGHSGYAQHRPAHRACDNVRPRSPSGRF